MIHDDGPFDEDLARAVEAAAGRTLFGRSSCKPPVVWKCRKCGCTNSRACPGGCSWVAPNLCSRCVA